MKFPFTTRKKLDRAQDALAKKEARLAQLQTRVDALKQEVAEAKAKNRAGFQTVQTGAVDARRLIATGLHGEGIEIGALHYPLRVPEGVKVRYVDMTTREENIRKFPELDASAIVETDYICNGETLEVIPDESQDFVIANHMMEHCINPLATLRNFLRVLRPKGKLFISLPDKRHTFDIKRPITPFLHIEDDFLKGRTVEDLEVYREWVANVDNANHEDPEKLHTQQANIHFHVWTQAEIIELFVEARRRLGFPIEIEWTAQNGCEHIVLARKTESDVELP
jgi:SAM-dependent methyltransferase